MSHVLSHQSSYRYTEVGDDLGDSFFFFQAEDGIRYYKVTGVSDVCSSDLTHGKNPKREVGGGTQAPLHCSKRQSTPSKRFVADHLSSLAQPTHGECAG